MKVSLNLIKQLINFELPPVDELVSRVNQQLGGVEEVIDLKAKYGGARIVRVVECEKHPNADINQYYKNKTPHAAKSVGQS